MLQYLDEDDEEDNVGVKDDHLDEATLGSNISKDDGLLPCGETFSKWPILDMKCVYFL